MPGSTRILAVDSDATSQGDVHEILVGHRFVVLGGTDLREETVTMARAFQPQVILLNLDDGQESYAVADLAAREFPEARLIAYSRRKDVESVERSAWVRFDGRPVKVVPAEERALLAAIESALTGPDAHAPITVDSEHQEIGPLPPVAPSNRGERDGGWAGQSRRRAEPFLRHFAELASEWLLTRSPQAEQSLMATLAEDVQAPSFGGRGRDVVRRGLEGLAWRLGGDFRMVPSELGGQPVLVAVVEGSDGHWHRAGHFLVGVADGSTVGYFDYRVDEPPGEGAPRPS
jgi:hypothetical protein